MFARAASSSTSVTPAPTRTESAADTLMWCRRFVLRRSSPRGVAPPVRGGCPVVGGRAFGVGGGLAPGGGAAGQRGLRADRQHCRRGLTRRGDLGFRPRRRHPNGKTAREMRRVFEKRGEHIGIALDGRRG